VRDVAVVVGGGLLLWEPMSSIFPSGMEYVYEKIGNKSLALHNRWFR
jgi:hypothetical protein